MQERDVPAATAPLGELLKAQAEGLGLMAWLGAALMDHAARMGSEMGGFVREQARRDLDALGKLANCRSPEKAVQVQGAYLGDKMTALAEEAERLGRLNAHMCDLTQKRLTGWQG